MVKLPVFDVLGQAFAAPFKFAWPLLPFYILSAAVGLSLFSLVAPPGAFLGTEEMVTVEGTSGYVLFGVLVLVYLIFTSTAVLTHRVVADVDHKWRLAWPVVRYFLIAIGLLLIGMAYALLCFFFVWAFVGFDKGFEMDATSLDPGTGVAVAVFALVGIVVVPGPACSSAPKTGLDFPCVGGLQGQHAAAAGCLAPVLFSGDRHQSGGWVCCGGL